MVLTHPFYCPTRVVEGHAAEQALATLLEGRPWVLATSAGWLGRGAVERLTESCGAPVTLAAGTTENPTIGVVTELARRLAGAEVVVALGGGSVIDAAKGAAALDALAGDMDPFLAHLREGTALPDGLSPKPIIAIPTTSGTGSEVTRWGTIWGEDGIKHSVNHTALYPSHAIMDPGLTTTMPAELTLSTALDAVSHAMEAVWNRRHTELTDALAAKALRTLFENIEAAVERPDDTAVRARVQAASVTAGLAMGTTQTALAHSISYPFTSRHGVPHGLACSFTLAEVARYNMAEAPERLAPIAQAFDCPLEALPDGLDAWLRHLGVGELLARYVTPAVTDGFGDSLITRARAANNIRDVDGADARAIARAALDSQFSNVKRWGTSDSFVEYAPSNSAGGVA